MKRYQSTSPESARKTPASEIPTHLASGQAYKAKSDRQSESPAQPPPVWTRYIDSRLKQFCMR